MEGRGAGEAGAGAEVGKGEEEGAAGGRTRGEGEKEEVVGGVEEGRGESDVPSIERRYFSCSRFTRAARSASDSCDHSIVAVRSVGGCGWGVSGRVGVSGKVEGEEGGGWKEGRGLCLCWRKGGRTKINSERKGKERNPYPFVFLLSWVALSDESERCE